MNTSSANSVAARACAACERLEEYTHRLQAEGPRVRETVDVAGETIGLVEKFLSEECGVECPAAAFADSRPLDDSQDDERCPTRVEEVSLCWERLNGRYGIGVRIQEQALNNRGAYDRTVRQRTVNWAACPVDLKLAAFPALPDLIQRIVENAEGAADRITPVAAGVGFVLAELDDGKILNDRKQKDAARSDQPTKRGKRKAG